MKTKIKLGDEVQCIFTGYIGIAQGYSEGFNGNIQFFVRPLIKSNAPAEFPESISIDSANLKVIRKQVIKEPVKPEEKTNIKIGDKVETLSKTIGIIYSRSVYWNRCVYFTIEYKDAHGIIQAHTISSSELTIVEAANKKTKKIKPPGGPSLPTRQPK